MPQFLRFGCLTHSSSHIMGGLCLYMQPTRRYQSQMSMVPACRNAKLDFGIVLYVVSEGGAEGVH